MITPTGRIDGRERYLCTECGLRWTSRYGPKQQHHACAPADGWPTAPAEQLATVQGWLADFYAGCPFADVAGAAARLETCLGKCKHFAPPRCSRAGNDCQSRRVWFGWLIVGECRRFEARP
jgi:hypothetical protein